MKSADEGRWRGALALTGFGQKNHGQSFVLSGFADPAMGKGLRVKVLAESGCWQSARAGNQRGSGGEQRAGTWQVPGPVGGQVRSR